MKGKIMAPLYSPAIRYWANMTLTILWMRHGGFYVQQKTALVPPTGARLNATPTVPTWNDWMDRLNDEQPLIVNNRMTKTFYRLSLSRTFYGFALEVEPGRSIFAEDVYTRTELDQWFINAGIRQYDLATAYEDPWTRFLNWCAPVFDALEKAPLIGKALKSFSINETPSLSFKIWGGDMPY
ncbi:MAG: hypothetical protein ACEQSA_03650 [Weeksellaceae bacterium]